MALGRLEAKHPAIVIKSLIKQSSPFMNYTSIKKQKSSPKVSSSSEKKKKTKKHNLKHLEKQCEYRFKK
jgi:hypothetical protein